MDLIVFISCAIVIASMVVIYELRLARSEKRRKEYNNLLIGMRYAGEEMIFDYEILVSILEDHFSKEDISIMFSKKRKNKYKEGDKNE